MKTSFIKTNVTPSESCRMGGFDRKEKSAGILDPIEVNIQCLDFNDQKIALIMIDAICIEEQFCAVIKKKCAEKLNTKEELILVSCDHTHSAPCYFKLAFEDVEVEQELTDSLQQVIIEKVQFAATQLVECTAKISTCMIDGCYGNRNVKEGYSDKSFSVLEYYDLNGKQLGCFANLSVHPTLLGGKNQYLSADLIGYVRRKLETYYHAPCIVSNGTCGDVSTRFYREQTPTLQACGDKIIEQFINKKETRSIELSYINSKTFTDIVISDFRNDKINTELLKNLEEANNPATNHLIMRCKRKISFKEFEMHLKGTILNLNDLIMVFLPGDICSEFGRQIKTAYPHKQILILGYTDIYCNYLVPKEDYGKYFETYNSRLQIGESDKFIQKIVNTIGDLIA